MSKRLQIILNEEAWAMVEATTNEANEGFQAGSITYSDTVAEMVVTSKVDVKQLQLKHTDFRRAMKNAVKGGMELDSVIKMLQELKTGSIGRRAQKSGALKEGGGVD